jgi:hypothetical protein
MNIQISMTLWMDCINKHGENYQKRISQSGRSSSIRKFISTLNGEIQQVNEESKETASIRKSFGIDL